jgi:hypothetical protein
MVEPTLEFLGRNLQMIQLDQRQIRSELVTLHTKLNMLSDKLDLLMDALGWLEARIEERLK